MPKLVNRAKMTTATTGTGTITLGSAVDGYQTFANAGVANSNVVRYTIEDGSAWEIGLGTYSSTGTTLTRGTIESSTGTAINLSGNATVFVTAAAGDLQELVTFAETFALPTADGTNGQVLTTNGSGTLTFTSPGASLSGQTDSATPFETSLGSGAGAVNTGVNNTFIGFEAGNDNTTGTNNVAVGFQALDVNTTGAGNVGVGNAALGALTTGSNNVAIGNGALDAATTGGRNIAIGQDAMGLGVATDASGDNIGIGYLANYRITSATNNIALGRSSLSNATSGGSNLAIGTFALTNNVTGTNNLAIGQSAGQEALGSNNVFLGHQAGDATTTGSNQIVIGQGSDASSATVSNEITLGNASVTRFRVPGLGIDWTSAPANLTGQTDSASPFETSLGSGAGAVNTGVNNTFVGFEAGNDNTTGTNNVAVGYQALDVNTTGLGNVGVGSAALGALTTGSNNVAIGNGALDAATTGGTNVAIGQNAMGSGVATAASGNNVAIGVTAANSITSGNDNVAIGNGALDAATTGGENVAIGLDAGGGVSTATRTVFIGPSAGSNASNGMGIGYRAARYSSAESNTAVGNAALADTLLTGNTNSAFGYQALFNVESGNGNTGVGYVAGSNITTGSNNMVLGNLAQASSATVSNEITLGDTSITNFRVPGVGFRFDTTDGLIVPKTVTAGGTTGAQTINKTAGTVNFAAAATSLVVTNSFVDTNSIIIATVGKDDTTMKSVAVVAGAGSFTLYANAAATAETRVNWFVAN